MIKKEASCNALPILQYPRLQRRRVVREILSSVDSSAQLIPDDFDWFEIRLPDRPWQHIDALLCRNCRVAAADCHVAPPCWRVIPRFCRNRDITTRPRISSWYLFELRLSLIMATGVLWRNEIPAHIITERPTQLSHYGTQAAAFRSPRLRYALVLLIDLFLFARL